MGNTTKKSEKLGLVVADPIGDESEKHYKAFCKYLESDRDLKSLTRTGFSGEQLQVIAIKYRWLERAAIYDQQVLEARERNKLQVMRTASIKEWQERGSEIRETEYSLFKQLTDKVNDILSYPIAVEEIITDENGNAIKVVKPMGFSLSDLTKMINTLSDIGRRAAQLPKEYDQLSSILAQRGITMQDFIKRSIDILSSSE